MPNLDKEWKRFKQHCQFTFAGPLAQKGEKQKLNYFMTYIGDKGRGIYSIFTFNPAVGENRAESDTLEGVYGAHVGPKKNEIRSTVAFNKRKQETGERFDNFVTDVRPLVKDAILLRSLSLEVSDKYLDKGDALKLEKVISIGQIHESSQESLRVIGEDLKVDAVTGARGRVSRECGRQQCKGRGLHGEPPPRRVRGVDVQVKVNSTLLCHLNDTSNFNCALLVK